MAEPEPEDERLRAAACVMGKASWYRPVTGCGTDMNSKEASQVLQEKRWRDRQYRKVKKRLLQW